MYCIVALGNPGTQYEKTRHNAGRIALDMILDKLKINSGWKLEKKRNAQIFQDDIQFPKNEQRQKIIFVKPQTFMNLSGTSVQPILSYFKISPKQLLVIHDDLDLPFGEIKYKPKGSSGGQNGIKDIINKLGTQEFYRMKIGIGRPEQHLEIENKIETVDRVLSKFSQAELTLLETKVDQIIHNISLFVQDKI